MSTTEVTTKKIESNIEKRRGGGGGGGGRSEPSKSHANTEENKDLTRLTFP